MMLSVTTEFHAEFEAEREQWLRNRFVWYCGFMAVLGLLLSLQAIFTLEGASDLLSGEFIARILVRGGQVALFGGAMAYASTRRRDLSRERVLRMAFWCVVLLGLMSLVVAPLASSALNAAFGDADKAWQMGPGVAWFFLLFVTHFAASLFIPWSPSEAMRPMTPLLLLASGLILLSAIVGWDSWSAAVFAVLVAWVLPLPGLVVAWFRHSRHRSRFHMRALTGRYGAIKRELVDARRIHESLFPSQVLDGPVRFAYRYEPMLQLGGDFVFLHPRPRVVDGPPVSRHDEPMSVVLIDVTGHGIAAALTVNRLDGELHRLYAEDPTISPGTVIEALNRYIHLTLAEHSVYATAFCACGSRPRRAHVGERRAPAGHAARRGGADRGAHLHDVRARGGRGRRLQRGRGVAPVRRGRHASALHRRGVRGAQLRRDDVHARRPAPARSCACAAIGRRARALAQRVLDDVDGYRAGPPSDDTLILEVSRVVGDGGAKPNVRVARSTPYAGTGGA